MDVCKVKGTGGCGAGDLGLQELHSMCGASIGVAQKAADIFMNW